MIKNRKTETVEKRLFYFLTQDEKALLLDLKNKLSDKEYSLLLDMIDNVHECQDCTRDYSADYERYIEDLRETFD